jgi:hypothetical protein
VEEARWGLDWILKTRFGDGFRINWASMDYWTDGVIGTPDDTFAQAGNSPFENYLAAAAEALAAQVLKDADAALAEKCLKAARDDWRFAVEKTPPQPHLELAAAASLASLETFRATGEKPCADKAVEFADVILASQQRERMPWDPPLAGFFYTGPDRKSLLHYSHRGHEQAPIVALAELCAAFPDHEKWIAWYSAVVLHSEYLKAVAAMTAPYGMLPASVYRLDEDGNPDHRKQMEKGVQLAENVYLRRFPVWDDFRGNCGTVLSQTKALSAAARLRGDLASADLCQAQLEWTVGRNPFSQGLMYGEGHDYAPQYTAMSGDMVGSLPVGIQTQREKDVPYWPAANCYNYKEVWVHPSSRWLWIQRDLGGPAGITGVSDAKEPRPVEFREAATGTVTSVAPGPDGRFQVGLVQGRYIVRHGERQREAVVLPGGRYGLDMREPVDLHVIPEPSADGGVVIRAHAESRGRMTVRLAIRTSNLQVEAPRQEVRLEPRKPETVTWTARIINPKEPWVAVVVPNENLADRQEVVGGMPAQPPARR